MVSPVILLIGAATAASAFAQTSPTIQVTPPIQSAQPPRVTGGFDFSPRIAVRELEGSHFSELLFKDGPSDVSYEPPAGWAYSGEKNLLSLWVPDKAQVDAKIVVANSGPPPAALDPATMQYFRSRAQAILPPGGKQIQFISEARDAVHIDAYHTYEATFEYSLFGQRFRTCILFVFLSNRQMTVQLSAHAGDFAEMYRVFHRSLFSFHWNPTA